MPARAGPHLFDVWFKADAHSNTTCPNCGANSQSLELRNRLDRFPHADRVFLTATITDWRCLSCDHNFWLTPPEVVRAKVIANHESGPRIIAPARRSREVFDLAGRAYTAFCAVLGKKSSFHRMSKVELRAFCHASRRIAQEAEGAQKTLDEMRLTEDAQLREGRATS